jgi:hypothetical protein
LYGIQLLNRDNKGSGSNPAIGGKKNAGRFNGIILMKKRKRKIRSGLVLPSRWRSLQRRRLPRFARSVFSSPAEHGSTTFLPAVIILLVEMSGLVLPSRWRSLQRRRLPRFARSVFSSPAEHGSTTFLPAVIILLVEMSGLEPPTSCLPDKRSPS